MNRSIWISALLTLGLSTSIAQKQSESPVSKEPIGSERLEIYRDFLTSYTAGSKGTLNVSQTTVSFSPDASDRTWCLSEFRPEDLAAPAVHTFSVDAFPKDAVKLVDPSAHRIRDPGDGIRRGQDVDKAVDEGIAAGLFTFSEVVFDSSHTHAAFSYSFHCGMLCGHGGITIYEKRDRRWQATKKQCGGWVS